MLRVKGGLVLQAGDHLARLGVNQIKVPHTNNGGCGGRWRGIDDREGDAFWLSSKTLAAVLIVGASFEGVIAHSQRLVKIVGLAVIEARLLIEQKDNAFNIAAGNGLNVDGAGISA